MSFYHCTLCRLMYRWLGVPRCQIIICIGKSPCYLNFLSIDRSHQTFKRHIFSTNASLNDGQSNPSGSKRCVDVCCNICVLINMVYTGEHTATHPNSHLHAPMMAVMCYGNGEIIGQCHLYKMESF